MNVYVPCPDCGWQEINGNFEKYEQEPKKTGRMHYKLRCTRCNWLGDIKFLVELTTERKGNKNHG